MKLSCYKLSRILLGKFHNLSLSLKFHGTVIIVVKIGNNR
jgi:hypothetical protein